MTTDKLIQPYSPELFGPMLRHVRKDVHGLGQADLVQKSGVGVVTIRKIEKDAHVPMADILAKLLRAMGGELVACFVPLADATVDDSLPFPLPLELYRQLRVRADAAGCRNAYEAIVWAIRGWLNVLGQTDVTTSAPAELPG